MSSEKEGNIEERRHVMFAELKEKTIVARRAFEKAFKDSAPDVSSLGKEYIDQAREYLDKLINDHPGAPGVMLTPGASSSWEDVASMRKDAEAGIKELQSEIKRVSEILDRPYKYILHGQAFETSDGTPWISDVTNEPDLPRQDTQSLLYKIEFTGRMTRHLSVITTKEFLAEHSAGAHEGGVAKLKQAISEWLEGDEATGVLDLNKTF